MLILLLLRLITLSVTGLTSGITMTRCVEQVTVRRCVSKHWMTMKMIGLTMRPMDVII